jgi:hypothetical protein
MSDEKDLAQALLKTNILPCSVYEHYKGGEYVVFAYSVHEGTLQLLVHYYSLEKKTRWTRPYNDFLAMMQNPAGETIYRFTMKRCATAEETLEAHDLRFAL